MSVDPTFKNWFTIAEASNYTGYSIPTLKRAVTSGELNFFQRKQYGPRRFHRSDLDSFVRGEPAAPTAVGV